MSNFSFTILHPEDVPHPWRRPVSGCTAKYIVIGTLGGPGFWFGEFGENRKNPRHLPGA